MYNYNIARDRINELQASAERERQVKTAKKVAGKPKFSLFFRRTSRPAKLSPERRAELIQQEWKA